MAALPLLTTPYYLIITPHYIIITPYTLLCPSPLPPPAPFEGGQLLNAGYLGIRAARQQPTVIAVTHGSQIRKKVLFLEIRLQQARNRGQMLDSGNNFREPA